MSGGGDIMCRWCFATALSLAHNILPMHLYSTIDGSF